jgi:hypothetical protein
MDTDQLEEMTDDQLEKREWDKVLNHPESRAFLKKLTEETKADIAAGRTKEWKTYRENLLHLI